MWYRWRDGDLVLQIRVQPRARVNSIEGLRGEALHIKLKAPPIDDQANSALITLLAREFGRPVNAVSLLRGATARAKTVMVNAPSDLPPWFTAYGGSRNA